MPEYKSTPPAFPQTGDTLIGEGKGMTLRDYFAATALTGLMREAISANRSVTFRELSGNAYEMADAMLKERAK